MAAGDAKALLASWAGAAEVAARIVEGARVESAIWEYCPDDEHHPRWRCSNCGKLVHKDPAEKLFCSRCGRRTRKEA